jgi:hypothetical protein
LFAAGQVDTYDPDSYAYARAFLKQALNQAAGIAGWSDAPLAIQSLTDQNIEQSWRPRYVGVGCVAQPHGYSRNPSAEREDRTG